MKCSVSVEDLHEAIVELKQYGRLEEDENGALYVPRMAREGSLSDVRSECGKEGGRASEKQNQKQNTLTEKAGAGAATPQVESGALEWLAGARRGLFHQTPGPNSAVHFLTYDGNSYLNLCLRNAYHLVYKCHHLL